MKIVQMLDGSGRIYPQSGVNLKELFEQYADDGFTYCSGIIGIPITFLEKYCPDQFEILGLSQKVGFGLESIKFYDSYKEMRQDGSTTGCSGHKMNGNPVLAGKPSKGNYYTDGYNFAYSLYGRVFIRRKCEHYGAH